MKAMLFCSNTWPSKGNPRALQEVRNAYVQTFTRCCEAEPFTGGSGELEGRAANKLGDLGDIWITWVYILIIEIV